MSFRLQKYMLEGKIVYLHVMARQEHVFHKGDLYTIGPGVVYAQKSAPHTTILFINVSPGNKGSCRGTSYVQAWLNNPDRAELTRRDYFYHPKAPKPNCILCQVEPWISGNRSCSAASARCARKRVST